MRKILRVQIIEHHRTHGTNPFSFLPSQVSILLEHFLALYVHPLTLPPTTPPHGGSSFVYQTGMGVIQQVLIPLGQYFIITKINLLTSGSIKLHK